MQLSCCLRLHYLAVSRQRNRIEIRMVHMRLVFGGTFGPTILCSAVCTVNTVLCSSVDRATPGQWVRFPALPIMLLNGIYLFSNSVKSPFSRKHHFKWTPPARLLLITNSLNPKEIMLFSSVNNHSAYAHLFLVSTTYILDLILLFHMIQTKGFEIRSLNLAE